MFPYVLFKWMPFKARLEGKEMDAKRDMGGGGGGLVYWNNFLFTILCRNPSHLRKKAVFLFVFVFYLSKSYAVLYLNSSALTKWHDLSLCQTCKLRILYVFGSCFRTLAVIVV